jgi:hypothetical protein
MPWAPLIGPERYDSDATRAVGYDFLKPTFGQSLGAGVAEELADYGPTGAILRMGEMDQALGETPQFYGKGGIYPAPKRTPVSEEQWKGSANFRPGLSYFDGMTEEAARLLAERFDIRAKRTDVLNRTEGVAVNSAVFAARFASQLVDPIGMVANFVPVVSQARYARLLGQLGRPGARAVTGLVEGAVGNALLEPLIYSAAQRDQLDYDMVDSLANVGFGAVFGAGVRVGGGAVADLLARRGGRAVAAAADTAIIQAAAGREIDVAPVLRAEAAQRARGGEARTTIEVDGQRVVDTGAGDDPTARLLAERQASEREQVRKAREYLRRGQEEDATRPQTFPQRREAAQAALLDAYPTREIQLQAADKSGGFTAPTGKTVTRKGPMDLATFVRAIGGVRDDAGELRGIDAKPRSVQFAKGEGFIGGLIKKDGLTLEAAARKAAEAGYIGRAFEEGDAVSGRGTVYQGGTDEFVEALERTIAAGDSMEGRVFGVDDDGPVQDFARTMREIDEEEAFSPAGSDRWMPLREEDLAADEEMGFDPIDLEGMDDPEALWREEMEREAAMKAEQPDAAPAAEGEPKPLTPEQQIALDAENYRAGIQAAAVCMGRAL